MTSFIRGELCLVAVGHKIQWATFKGRLSAAGGISPDDEAPFYVSFHFVRLPVRLDSAEASKPHLVSHTLLPFPVDLAHAY